MKPLHLVALFLLLPLTARASHCPATADFAGDVLISLTGPIVTLEWTCFETPDIESYRVIRTPAPATAPSSPTSLPTSPVMIAELVPDEEHLWTEHRYEFTDSAPPGEWVYLLRIRRAHARPCIFETEPLSVPEHPPCGSVDVCDQVAQSFTGDLIIGFAPPAVKLEWGSCAEDSSVRGYRVKRRRVGCSGEHCWRRRAFIRADGACGEIKLHSLTDEPWAGEYVYRVQVLDSAARAVCSVELDPVTVP